MRRSRSASKSFWRLRICRAGEKTVKEGKREKRTRVQGAHLLVHRVEALPERWWAGDTRVALSGRLGQKRGTRRGRRRGRGWRWWGGAKKMEAVALVNYFRRSRGHVRRLPECGVGAGRLGSCPEEAPRRPPEQRVQVSDASAEARFWVVVWVRLLLALLGAEAGPVTKDKEKLRGLLPYFSVSYM